MIDMAGRKLKGPKGKFEALESQRKQRFKERETARRVMEADRLGVEPPRLIECDPQRNGNGEDKRNGTLNHHLETIIAPYLKLQATLLIEREEDYQFVVGLLDKSRQNPLNHLGGKTKLGNEVLRAYWNAGGHALALFAAVSGGKTMDARYARVSPTSDEGVGIAAGVKLDENSKLLFRKCWEYARKKLDLTTYDCTLEVKNPNTGQTEKFEVDLKAFSRVLRHPDLAVACSYSISKPVTIDYSKASNDFVLDEIRKLENAEIDDRFYALLPEPLKGNGGLPEVETPFTTNLFRKGITRKETGSFVEIKFDISEFAREMLPLTEDELKLWGFGTRKGFAELFSGRGGMRFLNTFLGKARANKILTPIAQAMGDLKKSGVDVMPVSGSYLQYWTSLDDTPENRKRIQDAIGRRIHAEETTDNKYVDLGFDAIVDMIHSDMDVSDVRARFILNSLDKEDEHVTALDKADFLLNFFENVHKYVQNEIYEHLSQNGGRRITEEDKENIGLVRWLCSRRRTIRDVEDLVWTLREDDELPDRIKEKKGELENWVFEFAKEQYDAMHYLLASKIKREMGKVTLTFAEWNRMVAERLK